MNKYHKIFNRSTRRTGSFAAYCAARTADLRHNTVDEAKACANIRATLSCLRTLSHLSAHHSTVRPFFAQGLSPCNMDDHPAKRAIDKLKIICASHWQSTE